MQPAASQVKAAPPTSAFKTRALWHHRRTTTRMPQKLFPIANLCPQSEAVNICNKKNEPRSTRLSISIFQEPSFLGITSDHNKQSSDRKNSNRIHSDYRCIICILKFPITTYPLNL